MSLNRLPLLLLMALSCTDAQPCSTCPAVEGVWALQYLAPDFPCDGGRLADPPGTVQFTREGSVMRGAIDGVAITGTLYDTYDFSLSGTQPGGGLSVSLRAVYAAAGADGGNETLTSGRLSRSNASCRDDRRFTGARF